MTTRAQGWILVGVAVTLIAGPVLVQESAAVLKDLTAVIALHGLPCRAGRHGTQARRE
jgi:hypothetical protein